MNHSKMHGFTEDIAKICKEVAEKYKLGPTVDTSKEDMHFSYKDVDKYGFCMTGNLTSRTSTMSKKMDKNKEIDIQNTWLKILRNWVKYNQTERLKRAIFSGVPNSVRGELWRRILDIGTIIKSNAGVFESLKEKALQNSLEIRQIDLDINRTYRNHIMFKQRYGQKQVSLFNVLVAYTLYDRKVAYCQGMSSVAALLLMFMNEEDAFWSFSVLMSSPRYSMHGFFVTGFPKLMRFQIHHDNILRKMLPKLSAHFESEEIYSSLYTLKWYMQCFLDRLPFELILQLWDVFILEGDKLLHPIGYTLLKIHQKHLLKLEMDDIGHFLSNGMVNYDYNIKSFMSDLSQNIEDLKRNNLYPIPSTVEGELSESLPVFYSTLKERQDMKNEYFGDELDMLNKEEIASSFSPNSRIESNSTALNSSIRSIKFSFPPGIPNPPRREAPKPVKTGLSGHEKEMCNTMKKNNNSNTRTSQKNLKTGFVSVTEKYGSSKKLSKAQKISKKPSLLYKSATSNR